MIRAIANTALKSLSGEFEKLYSPLGRESIPPERLMRALLLQAFYSIRSERQLVERIDHDLLFRWFVGLGIEDPVWDATSFTNNRDRLLEGDVAAQFLAAVLAQDKCLPGAGRGQSVVVERAFLGRWNAVGSLGQPQKLSCERWLGRSSRPGPQYCPTSWGRAGLSRRAAPQ